MTLLIAVILTLLSPSEIPVGKPRIAMPDLVRSWSWVDQSLAAKPMDLEQRRAMSKRLDAITMLFFQNDIGAVANAMDDFSLELVVDDTVSDAHRAAAALLVRLDDGEPGTSLSGRWRYNPPEFTKPLEMTLSVTPVNGQAHEIDVLLSPGQDGWSLAVDEEALEALPPEGTMHLSLILDDGTRIPQGRWERTSVPFSKTRSENLAQLNSVDTSAARATFESRNARLRDKIRKMDITGHVLDRNQLRGELVEELEALKRGEDPYTNRAGDTWYMVPVGSTEMPVRIYAPADAIASREPLPLLIALHGAGGNEHFFMDGCGDGAIKDLADEHGVVVASPSTYVMASSMEPLGVLIETMSNRYSIDQDRIYLLGHSLGGMTAMGLVAAQPEMVDGVVAIAGGAPFPKNKPIPPVLAYAAEHDFIVPADMIESSARAAQAAGAPVTPRRPDGTGHLTIVMDVLPESIEWLMSLQPEGSGDSP